MVKENYSKKGMIMEALSYGGAGMMTTREFIVMCAWHLFEKPALLERFLTGGEEDQFAILEEILRLEPVATFVHRRAAEPIDGESESAMQPGELVAINIRDANTTKRSPARAPLNSIRTAPSG